MPVHPAPFRPRPSPAHTQDCFRSLLLHPAAAFETVFPERSLPS
ncbi:hypothetical protein NBRC3293_0732 [Gluconobacter oxydans NBRC 3293]|uniref:Uncharacterized protein n=1 Tax=Gluconobacter oxydans NBRC 3293 TaxID=1315969 RepID=A0A829WLT8_GLUOY|nr:hypothetical protein NBRC3293_0732 [Gluconobacter oxydans NBRC 3293]